MKASQQIGSERRQELLRYLEEDCPAGRAYMRDLREYMQTGETQIRRWVNRLADDGDVILYVEHSHGSPTIVEACRYLDKNGRLKKRRLKRQ